MKNKIIFIWAVVVILITVGAGVIYAVVQQDLRQSANDPQIQIAEDTAALLGKGVPPEAIISPSYPVDVSNSLATFANIYDSSGKVLIASGNVDGQPLILPSGVSTYLASHHEDRITWQPEKGVRLAMVGVSYSSASSSGLIIVARSLREVERREDLLEVIVGCGWLISVLLVTAGSYLWTKKL